MQRNHALLYTLALLTGCAGAPTTPATPPPAAPSSSPVQVSVMRYSEHPLTEYQTQVINQATKLSLACRIFRDLYGRWPRDLAEIESKSEGIDFGVFAGKASITPDPDDSEYIEVFDGFDIRATKAVPIDFHFTDAQRADAKAPGFLIKLPS